MDADRKILSFDGKFAWRDTITIQTSYASNASPIAVSCYGRGTTDEDVRSRDVTLGFHENCHQNDYVRYLRSHALPDPPQLALGMSESDYKKALAAFDKSLRAYFKAMERDSETQTDEVGYRKSTRKRTGKCFEHVLP